VTNWNKELKETNKNKRGGQYKFPDSFIKWEAVWKQWVDYRGLEGIARSLAMMCFIPKYNDYTTIWHRVHDMIPEIELPTDKDLEVATDGSGLKTNKLAYIGYSSMERIKKKKLRKSI
jgi:hypothetical protein